MKIKKVLYCILLMAVTMSVIYIIDYREILIDEIRRFFQDHS